MDRLFVLCMWLKVILMMYIVSTEASTRWVSKLEYFEFTLPLWARQGQQLLKWWWRAMIVDPSVRVLSSMMATFSHHLPSFRPSAQTPTIPVLPVLAHPKTKDAQPGGDPPSQIISEGRGDFKHHQTDILIKHHELILHQIAIIWSVTAPWCNRPWPGVVLRLDQDWTVGKERALVFRFNHRQFKLNMLGPTSFWSWVFLNNKHLIRLGIFLRAASIGGEWVLVRAMNHCKFPVMKLCQCLWCAQIKIKNQQATVHLIWSFTIFPPRPFFFVPLLTDVLLFKETMASSAIKPLIRRPGSAGHYLCGAQNQAKNEKSKIQEA